MQKSEATKPEMPTDEGQSIRSNVDVLRRRIWLLLDDPESSQLVRAYCLLACGKLQFFSITGSIHFIFYHGFDCDIIIVFCFGNFAILPAKPNGPLVSHRNVQPNFF